MVKIKLVSDIHGIPNRWQDIFTEDSCDYLILAGDICQLIYQKHLVPFIESICKECSFKEVFFVAGNHEYYNTQGYTYDGLLNTFMDETAHLSNFTVLFNQSVDLSQNLRLFGGTMWSHIPEGYEHTAMLPIYTEKGSLATSNWFNMEHYRFLCELEAEIARAQDDRKRLLVVTHHCPSFDLTLREDHLPSENRFRYCSALDRYLRKNYVYTWMYGHTHVNTDFLTYGDTRMVSNQYQGKDYNPHKVIHIKDEYKAYQ